jgi:hypothetical protein
MKRLTKADIRHIQTQKSFLLKMSKNSLTKPSSTLYLLSANCFYIVNLNDEDKIEDKNISLTFKDKTANVVCATEVEVIETNLEEFKDALEFFSINGKNISQILECTITEITNKG